MEKNLAVYAGLIMAGPSGWRSKPAPVAPGLWQHRFALSAFEGCATVPFLTFVP